MKLNPNQHINVGQHEISNESPCFIIAEVSSNFNGDLVLAKKHIRKAAEMGVHAIKFQTYSADEFVADKNIEFEYELLDGTPVVEKQYGMFKRLALPYEWHKELKLYAEEQGLMFLSSVADRNAVDLLDDIGCDAYKLASEDLINVDLLEYLSTKSKPIFLSAGMANEDEVGNALGILTQHGNMDMILLHCTSVYPTLPEDVNLGRMNAYRERFGFLVGFSDHTEGIDAPVLAASLGACVIEKHFTLDRSMKGPDHKFSSAPEIFVELVKKVQQVETLLGSASLEYLECEDASRDNFRRSIVASRDLVAGETIEQSMLNYKRPGQGLKPYEKQLILDKKLTTDMAKDAPFSLAHVEDT